MSVEIDRERVSSSDSALDRHQDMIAAQRDRNFSRQHQMPEEHASHRAAETGRTDVFVRSTESGKAALKEAENGQPIEAEKKSPEIGKPVESGEAGAAQGSVLEERQEKEINVDAAGPSG